MDGLWRTEFVRWCRVWFVVVRVSGEDGDGKWTDQSGFVGELWVPVRSGGAHVLIWMFLFRWIAIFVFVNIAVQFSSHIFPTLRRDPDARLGNTWAYVEVDGRFEIERCVVALKCMNCPFGSSTGMDGLVGDVGLGRYEVELSMKWPVAPVSAILSVYGADIELLNK